MSHASKTYMHERQPSSPTYIRNINSNPSIKKNAEQQHALQEGSFYLSRNNGVVPTWVKHCCSSNCKKALLIFFLLVNLVSGYG